MYNRYICPNSCNYSLIWRISHDLNNPRTYFLVGVFAVNDSEILVRRRILGYLVMFIHLLLSYDLRVDIASYQFTLWDSIFLDISLCLLLSYDVEVFLSQAFSSWYFSWTSGDPHRSGFKHHTALLLLLLSSSSSPLCRVFILIFLRQTLSLGNTVLQLFCCYYSRAYTVSSSVESILILH